MKKLLAIIVFSALIVFIGLVDGGAASGCHTHKEYATVEVVITLEDGNTFIAERYKGEITVNDHFSEDPTKWEITKY